MKLIRRAFFIESGSDERVGAVARAVGVDKSEIVDLLLAKGLLDIEKARIVDVMTEVVARRLQLASKESIKSASAKRRS